MKAIRFIPAAVAVLTIAGIAQAQDNIKNIPTMRETVVTATRTETTSGHVGGSSVSVLTAEQIENRHQSTAQELLKTLPGVDVVANGGSGTLSTVFIRGADNKNTLVLVDGIMINDPSSANRNANLADITTDNIERIEVVRGPMSVLYGSNATAGVINIITKTGKGPAAVGVTMEGGSYNTWKMAADVSGASDTVDYSLVASSTRTDGFSIANDENDRIPHNGNTSEEDGWENRTFSGKIGMELAPGFDVNGVVRLVDASVDIDDSGMGYAGDRFGGGWPAAPEPSLNKKAHGDSDQLIYRLNVHNEFMRQRLLSDISFKSSSVERQYYDNDGMETWDYEGGSTELGWQGQYGIGDHDFLFGASFYREEMESISGGITDREADVRSFFAQDQMMLVDSLDIIAGVRVDDHDRFGNELTWRLAPAYYIDRTGTEFKASYGTGFRAPSLYELYSSYGNPDLEAEKSKGYDVGFTQALESGNITFGATYFNMTFENRIDYDFATWAYNQLPGDTRVSGLESFVTWQPRADLDVRVNHTYTDTRDPDEERLVRRPLNKVNVNCVYRYQDKAVFNVDYFWVDERDPSPYAADINGNPVGVLEAYSLINLSARYMLNKTLTLYARVDNLLGEEYEEAWSYATPGRSGYVGIKAQF